jgi:hypothetical protein
MPERSNGMWPKIKIDDGFRLYLVESDNCAQAELYIGKDLPCEDFSKLVVTELYLKEKGWEQVSIDGSDYWGPKDESLFVKRYKLEEMVWQWLEEEYDFQLFEDYASFMYEPNA